MSSCARGVLQLGLHATSCLLTYIDQKFVKRVRRKSRSCIVSFASKTFRQDPRLSNNMYTITGTLQSQTQQRQSWKLALLSTPNTSKYCGGLHVVAFSKN